MNDCPRQNPAYRLTPTMLEVPELLGFQLPSAPQFLEVVQKVLQKRGSIFYFRWVIPADLRPLFQKTALVRSLHTSDYWTAQQRLIRYGQFVQKIKELRIGMSGTTKKEINDAVLKQMLEFMKQHTIETDYEESDLEYVIDLNRKAAARTKKMAITGDEQVLKFAVIFYGLELDANGLFNEEIDPFILVDMFNELPESERSRFKLLSKKFHLALSNNFTFTSLFLDSDFNLDMNDVFTIPSADRNVIEKENENIKPPVFSEFHRQFISYKIKTASLSEKLQKNYTSCLGVFLQLVEDKPISDYKRKDIRAFMDDVSLLPKRNMANYKGLSVAELLEMEIPDEDLISTKTAKEYLKWIQGVFAYAIDLEMIEKSPAHGIKFAVNSAKIRYSGYGDSEIRTLISGVESSYPDWKYWVVNLGAYTGMRLGEIVQLVSEAIKFDTESGIYYIHVSDAYGGEVKSDAAIRQVPVHQKLINAGFIDFAKNANGRLFNVASKSATQWFAKYREQCGVPSKNDMNERKVFHSFRHTFVTKAREKGISETLVQRVVGHETKGFGITDNYTHGFKVGSLKVVVDVIDYGF